MGGGGRGKEGVMELEFDSELGEGEEGNRERRCGGAGIQKESKGEEG